MDLHEQGAIPLLIGELYTNMYTVVEYRGRKVQPFLII